jgi:cytochrome b561
MMTLFQGSATMTRQRHHPLMRVLHWLIASLIIAALTMSALVMPLIPAGSLEMVASLRRHMMTGLLICALTLLRIVVRCNTTKPPALSSGMAWADGLAIAVHRIFDVLILTMIASGASMAILSGLFQIVFSGHGELPANLDATLNAVLDTIPLYTLHRYTAMALFDFIALHFSGAFYHQVLLRDNLLSRMGFACPWRKK